VEFPIVIGLGSFQGDDQAGWLAIEQLETLGYPRQLLHRAKSPAEILDVASYGRALIICDACQISEPVAELCQELCASGTPSIRRLSWPSDAIVYSRGTGSHNLSLPEVMELGRTLRSIPATAEVWTIRGHRWTPGTEPTKTVRRASHEVAQQIWSDCHHA
jgi:hypothetical protein